MKVKITVITLLSLAAVITIFLFFSPDTSSTKNITATNYDLHPENQQLTMLEAVVIAQNKAKEMQQDAKLRTVTSVNDEELGKKGSEKLGTDGKRPRWNITFHSPSTKMSSIVTISNSEIVLAKEVGKEDVNSMELIDVEEVVYDTPAIVDKAKKKHLYPGSVWTDGYNFVLRKDLDNETVLFVAASNDKGLFTKMFFNPTTGEYLTTITADY